MASQYEFRKRTIDPWVAAEFFPQNFAIGAFEQCLRGSSGGTTWEIPSRFEPELVAFIAKTGRHELAVASMAYLYAGQQRSEFREGRDFIELISQIRDGARTVAQAADTLVSQIGRQADETGTPDPVRVRALIKLADALNGEGRPAADYLPRRIDHQVGGPAWVHGLRNCHRLADHAEDFLSDYRKKAALHRREGEKVLSLPTGRKTALDRERFVIDLAELYSLGMKKKPSAAPGSPATGGGPSPFSRFIGYVFDGVREVADMLDISMEHGRPTDSQLRSILVRMNMPN